MSKQIAQEGNDQAIMLEMLDILPYNHSKGNKQKKSEYNQDTWFPQWDQAKKNGKPVMSMGVGKNTRKACYGCAAGLWQTLLKHLCRAVQSLLSKHSELSPIPRMYVETNKHGSRQSVTFSELQTNETVSNKVTGSSGRTLRVNLWLTHAHSHICTHMNRLSHTCTHSKFMLAFSY